MPTPEPSGSLLAPIASGERIEALDLLRGFAIAGMFIVHMTNGGWDDQLVAAGLTSSLDTWIERLGWALFRTKAVILFSFLFGFGFALQLDRATLHGRVFLPMYLRRMVSLFLLGHVVLVMTGNDVLVLYPLFGVAMLPARHLRSGAVLVLAALIVLTYTVIDTLVSLPEFFSDLAWISHLQLEPGDAARRSEIYAHMEGTDAKSGTPSGGTAAYAGAKLAPPQIPRTLFRVGAG